MQRVAITRDFVFAKGRGNISRKNPILAPKGVATEIENGGEEERVR